MSVLFTVALLSVTSSSYAQDTVLLVNGEYIIGRYLQEDDICLTMLRVNVSGKSKVIAIDRKDVFSLRIPGNPEKIIYVRDTADPQSWDVDNMKNYILGEQLAQKYYRPKGSIPVSFVVGAGGAYLGFAGLLIPALYLGGIGVIAPSAGKYTVVGQNEAVVAGFRDEARRIRNRNMAKGVLSGIVVTWVVKLIIEGID